MFIEEKLDLIIELLKAQGAPVTAVEPAKTRGRKAKGEVDGVAVAAAVDSVPPSPATTTPTQASAVADDPFADAAPKLLPPVSMEEVRKAILALRDATDQANALSILKKYGAANFGEVKPETTGAIVADAVAAMPKAADDPFAELPAKEEPKAAAVKLTLEDVKKAIVAAQKITSTDAAQKVVMDNGGVGAGAGGVSGPSLKALPEANYAKVIELLGKLPKTK